MFLLASLDGTPAGTGVGKSSSLGDAFYTMVRVLPAQRRAGVGTAVLAALSEQARSTGHGSLLGRLREDDADATALRRASRVRRDLARVPGCPRSDPRRRRGARARRRASRSRASTSAPIWSRRRTTSTRRRSGTCPSAPRRRLPGRTTEWRADTVDGPGRPARPVARRADRRRRGRLGRPVGALRRARRRGEPPHRRAAKARGRGIATALKREQARRAKRAGFRRIETVNDEENAPMRAVNARLGFEAEPVWLLVRGPLA